MKTVIAVPYARKVRFTNSSEQFQKLTGWPTHGSLGMCYVDDETGLGTIYVGDGNLGTLVHELTHYVLFLFAYVGIDPASSRGEPMAYMMDYLFSKFKDEL